VIVHVFNAGEVIEQVQNRCKGTEKCRGAEMQGCTGAECRAVDMEVKTGADVHM